MPNGETTGPFTGQISCPLPCLIGAAGCRRCALERGLRRAPAPPRARRGRPRARAALAHLGERAAPVGARRRELVARRRRAGPAPAAIWSRSRRMRSAASCSRCSRSASWSAWSCARVAQPPHAVGDLAVLVGDAVEELGALEQVAEAVGLEDHGERVGRVRLVDLHQARAPAPGAPWRARCAGARGGRAPPRAGRAPRAALLLLVEARPARAPRRRCGRRDLALESLDAGVEALDRRGEHALLLPFCSIWSRFFSMRCDRGGRRRQGARGRRRGSDGTRSLLT